MNDSRRRDFLKVAGGVAVVGGLAGCAGEAQEEGEPAEPEEEEPGAEPDAEPEEEEEPEEDEEETVGDDLIRVAHMIPDFPSVDVYVDDSEEPVFSGVSYTNTTDYVELPEGDHQIRVTAADARSLVIFNEQVTVPAGNTTAVALGEPEEDEPANGQQEEGGPDVGFQLELFEDNNTPPEESINDSRLRLIHASPDAPAVDVRVGQTTVFEDVSFGEGEYFELPAGDYEFEVFPANGEGAEDEPAEDEEGGEGEEGEEDNGVLSTLAADGGSNSSLLQQEEDDAPAEEPPEDEGMPEDEPAPGEEADDEEPAPEDDPEAEEEPEDEPEDDEPEDDEPVFTFSATTEQNSVSTAFAVGYLDAEAASSDEEFDVVLAEDVIDGEVVEEEDDD